MAYLLFIDESGQDRQESPYEVLAGAAIHDTQFWDFVQRVQAAEERFFGSRVTLGPRELKARKLLNTQTFRQASWLPHIPLQERAELAGAAIADGASATREQITALAQAKIDYCRFIIEQCATHAVRLFASIVERESPYPAGTGLRKDYAYLFERFFYFLDAQQEHERVLVIFDELERSQAHLLSGQMSTYFADTRTGQTRAQRIIPEPLFVHSELTTGIQVADLVAYTISWNVRVAQMSMPKRRELDDLGQAVLDLRHRAIRERPGYPDGFAVWSFAVIDDLRPQSELRFEEEFAVRFDEELSRLTRGE